MVQFIEKNKKLWGEIVQLIFSLVRYGTKETHNTKILSEREDHEDKQ
jgi:hypothetical protein